MSKEIIKEIIDELAREDLIDELAVELDKLLKNINNVNSTNIWKTQQLLDELEHEQYLPSVLRKLSNESEVNNNE